MLTAFLTEVMGSGSVRLTANGHHVATYPITQDDGPGPIPAAEAVLAARGWRRVAPGIRWDHRRRVGRALRAG